MTKTCDICSGPLNSNNSLGVCSRSPICLRERVRRWRAANPEKYSEGQHRWRKANPEKFSQYSCRWQKANPEKHSEYSRRWQEANPEKYRENRRGKKRRRRARKLAATIVPFTTKQLATRMTVFDNKCVYCGGPFEHVDHFFPLSRGGAHSLDNLVPACSRCNQSKNDSDPLEWMMRRADEKQRREAA